MVEEANITIGTPITLKCGKTLKNRIAKGAIAEFHLEGKEEGKEGGDHTEFHHTLYKRWAEGGVGMILTGHIFIDRDIKGDIADPVIDENSSMEAFAKTAQMCQLEDCLGVVQLNHPGRQAMFCRGENTLAPSAVPFTGPLADYIKPPKALTEAQIEERDEIFP